MNNGELVMDIGTVLDGEGAVQVGLIDELGGLQNALGKLYDLIDEEDGRKKPRRGRRPRQNSTRSRLQRGPQSDPHHIAAGSAAAPAGAARK